MNRYKLAKCLYILPKVFCFFSGKDSDYKKHIINPIKKEKAYPNRLPLQAYRITYLHTVNIVAAMSSPKLNTFFIKFFISIIHIQVYKKERQEAKSIPPVSLFRSIIYDIQLQKRFLSPNALSIRATFIQNLLSLTHSSGKAAFSREYGCFHSSATTT